MSNAQPKLTLHSPKQREGEQFELQAVQFLQHKGLVLVAQNWFKPKVGELDIVMLEQGKAWDVLVFVEVRKRAASQFGDALTSITSTKQRKIINTARFFLQDHVQYAQCECRFDVLAFDVTQANHQTQPEWVQGAFYADVW